MTDDAASTSGGGFSSDEGLSEAIGSEYVSNMSSGSAEFSGDSLRSSQIRAAASGGTNGLSSLGLSNDGLSQRSYDSHMSSDSMGVRYVAAEAAPRRSRRRPSPYRPLTLDGARAPPRGRTGKAAGAVCRSTTTGGRCASSRSASSTASTSPVPS